MQDEAPQQATTVNVVVNDTDPVVNDKGPVCGTLPECDAYNRQVDKGYSRRRAWYIGLTTAWCIITPVVFVFTGKTDELAKTVSAALLGLSGTVCVCYIGGGVLDRSQILHKIGDGWARRREDEEEGHK